jgi:alpha-galactosidase
MNKEKLKEYKPQLSFYYKLTAKNIIEDIKKLRESVIELELLDEQWFLNFQDELNKLSIDPDRE